MIKIIYIYLLIIFFNCASQAPPQGGPRDIEGPILLEIQPNNKSNISKEESTNNRRYFRSHLLGASLDKFVVINFNYFH